MTTPTNEDKVVWDDLRRRKRDFPEAVTEFPAMLKESEDGIRRFMLEEIQHAKGWW